jgi:hypothetical protein
MVAYLAALRAVNLVGTRVENWAVWMAVERVVPLECYSADSWVVCWVVMRAGDSAGKMVAWMVA